MESDLPELVPPKPQKGLTPRQINKAAKGVGLTTIDSKTLQQIGLLGKAVEDVDPVRLGNGFLLVTREKALEILDNCSDIVAKDGIDMDAKAKVLNVQKGIIKELVEVTKALKTNATQENTPPTHLPDMPPPPAPHTQSSPQALVQVNVESNSEKTSTVVKSSTNHEPGNTMGSQASGDPADQST